MQEALKEVQDKMKQEREKLRVFDEKEVGGRWKSRKEEETVCRWSWTRTLPK